jgi:hypothetical protein
MNAPKKTQPLGPITATPNCFPIIEFKDMYGTPCSLEMSSLAEYRKPGISALWLGVDPVPEGQDQETTHMHLNREQVQSLISHLEGWLDRGSFEF